MAMIAAYDAAIKAYDGNACDPGQFRPRVDEGGRQGVQAARIIPG